MSKKYYINVCLWVGDPEDAEHELLEEEMAKGTREYTNYYEALAAFREVSADAPDAEIRLAPQFE